LDLDGDLVSHWIPHYLKYKFDTYSVILHNVQPGDGRVAPFQDAGFNISYTMEQYSNRLRGQLLWEHIKWLPMEDYIVVADSDEFQECGPTFGFSYRDFIKGHDVVEGTLVDRWDDTLKPAKPDIPLKLQYPQKGILRRLEGDREPCRKKIMAFRRNISVCLSGNHYVVGRYKNIWEKRTEGGAQITSAGPFKVLHYTFREHYLDRLLPKEYYYPWDIEQLAIRFGVPDHPAVDKAMRLYRQRQQPKGWIPAGMEA
jgi:hypothetical protein